MSDGSAPTSAFSRPARRSLALRPAYSPRRHAACFLEGSDGFVTSTAAPNSYRLERPSCRVGIAPTEELRLFTAHRHASRTTAVTDSQLIISGSQHPRTKDMGTHISRKSLNRKHF